MNLGVSLAVYALVMKELGQPLIFPYGREAYHCLREFVDNRLVFGTFRIVHNTQNVKRGSVLFLGYCQSSFCGW